jgi:beta-phosphoglucomutase
MTLELKINPDKVVEIDAIGVDLDGTTADTDDCWIDISCQTITGYGFEVNPEQRLGFSGRGNLFAYCLENWELGITRAEFNQRMWEIFYSVPISDRNILPMEGAGLVLEALAACVPLVLVSTNRTDYAELVLKELGLRQHFQDVVGGDQVPSGRGKPEPDLYLKAFADLGVDPKRGLALEDSEHGVKSAKEAGITCIVIPNRNQTKRLFSQADLVLPNLLEVLKLVTGKDRVSLQE